MLFILISISSFTLTAAGFISVVLYKNYKTKKRIKKITSIIDVSMDGINFDCGVKEPQLN